MTTRTTVIEGKITANTKEFDVAMVRARDNARRQLKEMDAAAKASAAAQTAAAREVERANKAAADAADKASRAAKAQADAVAAAQKRQGEQTLKAGNAIAGATTAIQNFGTAGTQSVTGVTKSLASVGALLGPTGAIIGGSVLAGVALVEMFVRPRRELAELQKELDDYLRKLRNAGDAQGSIELGRDIRFGNADADDIVQGDGDIAKRANAIVKNGGLIKARADLAKLEVELRAIQASADAIEAQEGASLAGRSGAERRKAADIEVLKRAIKELTRVQEQADEQGRRLAAADINREDFEKKQQEEEKKRTKAISERESATEKLANTIRTLEQRLQSVAAKGDGPASLALQLESLFDQVKRGGAGAGQLATFRAQIDALVKTAQGDEIKKLSDELDEFVAQSTITAVDDLQIAAQKLLDTLGKNIDAAIAAGSPELAAQWIEQRDAAAAYQRELAEVTTLLEDIAAKRKSVGAAGTSTAGAFGINLGSISATALELQNLQRIDEQLKSPNLDPRNRAKLEAERADIQGKINTAKERESKLTQEQLDAQKKAAVGARQYLDVMIAVAAAVGGVNQEIVRGLSGIGSVLDGVKSLQKATKDAGGFSQLFSSGKGVLAAASGVGAIVGGFSVVADAFDLFGSKSRQRAKEMQEAAIAWGRALDDFVITSRSTLEDGLRQNLARAEALYKQAAAASGVTTTGVSIASADDLRQRIAALEPGANVSSAFAKFRDELQKLLAVVEANEAALRKENQQRVADATTQAEIRRLTAEGRTEEAAVLRALTASELELREARKDTTDEGKAYVVVLEALVIAEREAAAAAQLRTRTLNTLDATLSITGQTGVEALGTIGNAIGTLAPELAGLADGLDLSTREGLEAFRTKLRDYYQTLAVDGISELEQPIVDFIRRFLGGIEGALDALPEALDPALAAVEAFEARARIFGTGAGATLAGLLPLLGEQFGEIGALLDGIDTSTQAGRDALSDRLLGMVDTITADGVIDASEAALLDVINKILGALKAATDEAVAEGEQLAAELEADRVARVNARTSGVAADIELNDKTGTAATSARIAGFAALAPALQGLLSIDLSTIEGLDQAKAILRDVFAQIEDGSISAEDLGDLLGPELRDIVLDLDGEFDGLKDVIIGLGDAAKRSADELADFARSVDSDFLRATGKTLEAEIADITANTASRRQRAIDLGASPETLAQIEAIGQSQIDAAKKRAADDARAAAERAAAANSAPGSTSTSGSSGVVITSTSGGRTSAKTALKPDTRLVTDIGGLSEITAQTMAGYLRSIAQSGSDTVELLSAGLKAPPVITGVPPLVSQLASSSNQVARSGPTLRIDAINVTVSGLSTDGTIDPNAMGAEIAESIFRELGRQVQQNAAFSGSAS